MTAPNATATPPTNLSPPNNAPPTTGAIPSGSVAEPNRAASGEFTHSPEEWRYPANFHVDWMRGKTASEVASLSNAMYQQLVSGRPQTGPPQQAAQTQYNASHSGYAPSQNGNDLRPPTDEEWTLTPALAAQRQRLYDQQMQQPALQQRDAQVGALAMEVIKLRYPEEFRKWGPQIVTYASQLSPDSRTVDMLEKVVGVVRSEHIDEIVAERSKRMLDEAIEKGTVLRPGAAGGTSAPATTPGVQFDALPPNYRRLLETYRITPETLDEFLMATEVATKGVSLNDARKAWLEKAAKGDVITEQKIALGGAA